MTQSLQFRLKSGQRIYVNGAVLRVDRKVAIEFLNDVTFMLDSHVLQVEDATTPLKQLYFSIQMVLMDPSTAETMRDVLNRILEDVISAFKTTDILLELSKVRDLLQRERYFESLKLLRALFPLEAEILIGDERPQPVLASVHMDGSVAWK
ncbi:MAG: flagellar biosynthesis repressor FlbT [Hyphomicrobiaceae bacterium]